MSGKTPVDEKRKRLKISVRHRKPTRVGGWLVTVTPGRGARSVVSIERIKPKVDETKRPQ